MNPFTQFWRIVTEWRMRRRDTYLPVRAEWRKMSES